MTVAEAGSVGVLLRHWRERRRLSQLELAGLSDVSARHVSFIETGRSNPTRTMLLNLAETLDVPLRERNSLLLAAGFAPVYPEHDLDEPPMTAIFEAIQKVLDAQLPFPAVVVDRHWTMVDANDAVSLLTAGCAAHLLEPPVNVLRLSLHPDGLAPRIVNLGQWRAHLLERLSHQIAVTGDADLSALHDELAAYPCDDPDAHHEPGALLVPLVVETDAGPTSFFSTTTVFGTPLDVTLSEIAIESFYPADAATAALFAR